MKIKRIGVGKECISVTRRGSQRQSDVEASVIAGKMVSGFVRYGCPRDANCDGGMYRRPSLGQVITSEGIPGKNHRATVCKAVYQEQ